MEKIKLDELKAVDKFLLSFPLRPERYNELREILPGFPLIIINQAREIVFGIDYYHYLKSTAETYTNTLCVDISDQDALILNLNLKEKLTGVNLYEKLVFLQKAMEFVPRNEMGKVISEIHRKTTLDINVNPELLKRLDLLVSTEFRNCFIHQTVSLKSGLRLCDFLPEDRALLIELFTVVPFSSSHQLKILEMAEEILFREKCHIADIFEKLKLRQYMDTEKPQKKIIDALFTYRNPLYTQSESAWEQDIKQLNLPGNIKVTHFPFFEKRGLELTIQVADKKELKSLIEKLKTPGRT